MHHVELASRAARDLRKIKSARARRDIARCLQDELTTDPHPENMDLKPLRGRSPWLRARCGEHRILFRALTQAEVKKLGVTSGSGYLVARIIDRAELERAVASL